MPFRTIMLPVRGDGRGSGLLDHALAIGREGGSHIDVVHCRARPEDMLPYGVFLPNALREQIKSAADNMADTEEEKLRPLFEDYAKKHKIAVVDAPPWPMDRTSMSWCERTGKQASIIAVHGRLSDLVVVARPDRAAGVGMNTLEAALFSTGKPVLMCPPGSPEKLGEHVAVAWNGSTEAARTISMAMPILTRAGSVTILSVGSETDTETGAEALAAYLSCHGIEAAVINRQESRIAQTLLGEAASCGADMLLMGAYGQSRQLELVMGGVTQHIVDNAELPVLMAH